MSGWRSNYRRANGHHGATVRSSAAARATAARTSRPTAKESRRLKPACGYEPGEAVSGLPDSWVPQPECSGKGGDSLDRAGRRLVGQRAPEPSGAGEVEDSPV